MRFPTSLLLLGGWLVLSSCSGGDKDTSTETDADADTDADTDTDTDADTDADTDTDTTPTEETDCGDDVDNDADGLTDCLDSDCVGTDACKENCGDRIDNDKDGLTDCEDDDCNCFESSCTDGVDNDLDGLTDCEDDECLEICVEDCGDGADNDADGLVDCDDDECFGGEFCPAPYTLELTWGADLYFTMGYGDLRNFGISDSALLVGYGYPEVTATPDGWSGSGFSCKGYMYGLSDAIYGYSGDPQPFDYVGAGGDYEPSYIFSFEPTTADGSLVWGRDCPLTSLPYALLGFTPGDRDIMRQDAAGAWYTQYSARNTYSRSYPGRTYDIFSMGRLVVPYPVTWSGEYGF